MGYDDGDRLYKAVICVDDLKWGSTQIEKALRRKLKVRSRKETDLTQADFSYFLPQVRPMWEDAWKVERHTDVMFYNCYKMNCFARVYEYCSGLQYATPFLGLFFQNGMVLSLSSGFTKTPQKKVNLRFSHNTKATENDAIHQTKQTIEGIADAFGITSNLVETKDGFDVVTGVFGNVKINSDRYEWSPVNPGNLGLQISDMPFSEVDALFRNAVEYLCKEIGDPKFIRLQRQVLHHEAAATAKEVANIDDRWDMKFFSEYRKKFDPFTRPANVDFERMYPVVRHVSEPIENDFFLDLQVTVYHGPDESYLLLHTQRDQAFLQEIADEAGVEISEFGIKDYHGLDDLKI